jgi:hypothetical protein
MGRLESDLEVVPPFAKESIGRPPDFLLLEGCVRCSCCVIFVAL